MYLKEVLTKDTTITPKTCAWRNIEWTRSHRVRDTSETGVLKVQQFKALPTGEDVRKARSCPGSHTVYVAERGRWLYISVPPCKTPWHTLSPLFHHASPVNSVFFMMPVLHLRKLPVGDAILPSHDTESRNQLDGFLPLTQVFDNKSMQSCMEPSFENDFEIIKRGKP